MADVVGENVPEGKQVKWYGGGAFVQISHTVLSAEAAAGGFSLGGTYLMEFGSVWITVNDVQKSVTECHGSGTVDATESSGTNFIEYTGIAENDVVAIYGVDISTVTLMHVATCKDVKDDTKGSSKKTAVHGQSTKLISVGVAETTATLEELMYELPFVGLVFGDVVTSSPNTGWSKWSNKTHSFKKIGALVGKRRDSAGNVVDKYFMIEATANSYGRSFPTEDQYSESFGFDCGYLLRARKNTT